MIKDNELFASQATNLMIERDLNDGRHLRLFLSRVGEKISPWIWDSYYKNKKPDILYAIDDENGTCWLGLGAHQHEDIGRYGLPELGLRPDQRDYRNRAQIHVHIEDGKVTCVQVPFSINQETDSIAQSIFTTLPRNPNCQNKIYGTFEEKVAGEPFTWKWQKELTPIQAAKQFKEDEYFLREQIVGDPMVYVKSPFKLSEK